MKIAKTPRFVTRGLALVMPLMREIEEMMYQWDAPFVADDRRFRERFGVAPTDADTAAKATVDWAVAEPS